MPAIEVIELKPCRCGNMPELYVHKDAEGRDHFRFACRRYLGCLLGEGVVMRTSHKAWARHHAAMAWQERVVAVEATRA